MAVPALGPSPNLPRCFKVSCLLLTAGQAVCGASGRCPLALVCGPLTAGASLLADPGLWAAGSVVGPVGSAAPRTWGTG